VNDGPILVTGGAGYIGSHTCVELLNSGYRVAVIDNLSNSKPQALSRVQSIAGQPLEFIRCDLLDKPGLLQAFNHIKPSAVIHFAGLKAVGESVENPLMYYRNNIAGTINLLDTMNEMNVKTLVFSSSCTVYGIPQKLPLTEESPLQAVNPYGQTKLSIEYILQDLAASDPAWVISILRYFNPVGAHHSGMMGEDPLGVPNNLMPYITKVAIGELEELSVWGSDYDTPDGTCIRDYIHVTDLAKGHIKALQWLPGSMNKEHTRVGVHNLGTGRGYSVLEIIESFRRVTGRQIPFRLAQRRAGDAPAVFADVSRAASELRWKAELGIDEMCADAWRWQQKNPQGYC